MHSLELWPWAHSIETDNHNKVIELLRKLPKGTNVFIEGSEEMFEFIKRSIAYLNGEDFNFEGLPKRYYEPELYDNRVPKKQRYQAFFTNTLAAIDLYLVAQSRGINLIPIEKDSYVKFLDSLRKKYGDSIKTDYYSHIFREKVMLNTIFNMSKEMSNSAIVLLGAEHIEPIRRLLLANSFDVRIREGLLPEVLLESLKKSRRAFELRDEFFARNFRYRHQPSGSSYFGKQVGRIKRNLRYAKPK